jgi:hypothetical protein
LEAPDTRFSKFLWAAEEVYLGRLLENCHQKINKEKTSNNVSKRLRERKIIGDLEMSKLVQDAHWGQRRIILK